MRQSLFLAICVLLYANVKVTAQITATKVSNEYFSAAAWRNIGLFGGGRSTAVTGVSNKPTLFYMGSTGGGIWKTTDTGHTWQNISDGFFRGSVGFVGSVPVSKSDNNVMYLEMR